MAAHAVANAIRKLEPPAWIEQTRVPVAGSKEILVLETTRKTEGPYTFDGRPYQRIGNTTSRIPQHEYERRLLARSKNQQRWETEVAEGYPLDNLDSKEIKRSRTILPSAAPQLKQAARKARTGKGFRPRSIVRNSAE